MFYSIISCGLKKHHMHAVWKELEKENKDFFETYNKDREERKVEAETMARIEKMLSEAAASKSSDDEG